MLTLLAPAVGNMSSTAGRKGAVNILMNTFEQARAAAITSSSDVYVIFYRRVFPNKDRIMVIQERTDLDTTQPYEQLSKWIDLPKGVILYDSKAADILDSSKSLSDIGIDQNRIPGNLTPAANEKLNAIKYNSVGGVSSPSGNLFLYVSQGVRGTDGIETITQTDTGIFEMISLRRFTGRASLDVSTL